MLYISKLQIFGGVVTATFANFVLNKKLGCIIQNCSLGGCAPRWLCGVSLLLFPCRLIVVHRLGVLWVFGGVSLLLSPCRWSMFHRLGGVSLGEMWGVSSVGFYGCSVVRFCFNLLQGDSGSSARCSCQCRGDMAVIWRCGSVFPSVVLWCFQ